MIEFGALGPLLLLRSGERQAIPRAGLRRLLALLLVRAGAPTPVDMIVEQLWPGRQVNDIRPTLHVYLSQLRQLLGGDDRLETHPGAYAIRPLPHEFDVWVFQRLIAESDTALKDGERAAASVAIRAALDLWRGPAYEDVRDITAVAAEAARLDELRLNAYEDAFDLELEAGDHARIVAEVSAMAAANPYRERIRAQHLLALYRCGRQSEALDAYRQTYDLLTEEMGVEPGPELQDLHRAVLANDPVLHKPLYRRAAPVIINMLPRSAAHFTGRQEQLAALDAIATGDTSASPVAILSTVTGAAGVGKTALAVHWAGTAADRFPAGQLYINLQGWSGTDPLSPLDALKQFLGALGVAHDAMPVTETAAIGQYRSILSTRNALVVLDNALSAAQVRPLLPTGPGCMSIVTSRDRLTGLVARDGAYRVAVDMLSAVESLALLTAILGADRVESEPEAAAALAHACGYLPLALRIAAAALIDEPECRLEAYAATLSAPTRLPLLTVDGDPDSSVGIALSHSYLRLTAPEQRMFRLLGLAPVNVFGAPAAAALAGCEIDEAVSALDRLSSAHLLDEQAAGRYRFHDLIRDYARELAAIDEPPASCDAALDRILAWYIAHSHNAKRTLRPETHPPDWVDSSIHVQAFADQAAALAWFDCEGLEILVAVRAVAATRPRQCWQLANTVSQWLQRQRRTYDLLGIGEIGLAAASGVGDLRGEVNMRTNVAIEMCYLGRQSEALLHFIRVLAIIRDTGTPNMVMTSLANLGALLAELNRFDEAISYLTEALDLTEQLPPPNSRARILNGIGHAHLQAQRNAIAVDFLERAVAACEDPYTLAGAAADLGAAYVRLGRVADGIQTLNRSLAAAIDTADTVALGRALTGLGLAALNEGRIDDAHTFLDRAIDAEAENDRRADLATLRNGLAEADNRPPDSYGPGQGADPISSSLVK